MKNRDNDQSGYAIALLAFAPLGIALADLLGRIRQLFLDEWPYVSWGLLILVTAAGIVSIYYRFINAHEHLEVLVKDKTKEAKAIAESVERANSYRLADINRILELHRNQLDRQGEQIRGLLKQVKELTERKVIEDNPVPAVEEVIDQAMDEIIEGGI